MKTKILLLLSLMLFAGCLFAQKKLSKHHNRQSQSIEYLQYQNTKPTQIDYSFDIQGNMTSYYTYSWNSDSSAWDESQQVANSYDVNGNLIEGIVYYWNTDSLDWTKSMIFT